MNRSIDVAIADAVVQLLTQHAARFTGYETIERRLIPVYSQSDLATGRIAVAPRLQTREVGSRASTIRQHAVQIAPHIRIGTTNGQPSETDAAAFCNVMETIGDVLEHAALTHRFAGATILRIISEPLYDTDLAASPGVLRGIWTVTFKRAAGPTPLADLPPDPPITDPPITDPPITDPPEEP